MNRSLCCQRLLKRTRRLALAWNVDFWRWEGVRTFAMLGTESEVMAWAREKAKRDGVKRWATRPHLEFNNRYDGTFRYADCPDWRLVRSEMR